MKQKMYFLPFAFVSIILSACGNKDEATPASANRSYQAAGSRWALTMTDSSFTLDRYASLSSTTATMNITGTVSSNSTNLFKVMTVTTATGTDAPTAGTKANALEMVGSSTFIQPFGSADPLVATVVSTCPSADFVANWVVTRPQTSGGFQTSAFDSDGSGIATFAKTADTFLVQGAGITNGTLQSAGAGTTFTSFGMTSKCSSGKLPVEQTIGGNLEKFDMYFTPTGQIVVKFSNDQIISGFPQTASAVTAASLDGTYSVLVYRGGDNVNASQATIVPAKLTLSAGAGALREITAVADNTEAASDFFSVGSFSVADDSANAMPKGQFRLALTGGNKGNGQGKLTCATTDASPRTIACYGFYNTASNASGDRRPITVLGRIR